MDKRIREQLRVFKDEGLKVTQVVYTSGHHKVYVDAGTLGPRFITISGTPGRGSGGGAFITRDRCRRLRREIDRSTKQ
jgi:hypothetical protein